MGTQHHADEHQVINLVDLIKFLLFGVTFVQFSVGNVVYVSKASEVFILGLWDFSSASEVMHSIARYPAAPQWGLTYNWLPENLNRREGNGNVQCGIANFPTSGTKDCEIALNPWDVQFLNLPAVEMFGFRNFETAP